MNLTDSWTYGRKVIRGSLRSYKSRMLEPTTRQTMRPEMEKADLSGYTPSQRQGQYAMQLTRRTFTPPAWWNIALAECRKIQPKAVKLCLKVYHSQTHGVTVPDAIKFLEERSNFEAVNDVHYQVGYEFSLREKKHKDGTYLTYIFDLRTREYHSRRDETSVSRVVIQTSVGTSKN